MNKYTYSMLLLLVIAGVVLFGGFAQYFSYAVTAIIPLLAILAWFNNVSTRHIEKNNRTKSDVNESEIEGEFHNDFSKVPAGTADPIQPPPRSIGYGYGDGGRSVIEDLERIGIVEKPDKKRDD